MQHIEQKFKTLRLASKFEEVESKVACREMKTLLNYAWFPQSQKEPTKIQKTIKHRPTKTIVD